MCMQNTLMALLHQCVREPISWRRGPCPCPRFRACPFLAAVRTYPPPLRTCDPTPCVQTMPRRRGGGGRPAGPRGQSGRSELLPPMRAVRRGAGVCTGVRGCAGSIDAGAMTQRPCMVPCDGPPPPAPRASAAMQATHAPFVLAFSDVHRRRRATARASAARSPAGAATPSSTAVSELA